MRRKPRKKRYQTIKVYEGDKPRLVFFQEPTKLSKYQEMCIESLAEAIRTGKSNGLVKVTHFESALEKDSPCLPQLPQS